jgi:hypothetical protein
VHIIRNRLAALGAAVVVLSCSSGARSTQLSPAGVGDLPLTVTNENWLDVAIYVVRGDDRFRIGEAVGNTTARLRIPGSYIIGWTVQLMADPVGSSDTYVTDVISVAPGEHLQLTVAPRMRMSSYAAWNR